MEVDLHGIGQKIVVGFRVDELSFNDRLELFSILYKELGFTGCMSRKSKDEINDAFNQIRQAANSHKRSSVK